MPRAASFPTASVPPARLRAAMALPSRMSRAPRSFWPAGPRPATRPRLAPPPPAAERRAPLVSGAGSSELERSVPEVADAGEVQGDVGGLSGGDDLIVADRATRLDDGPDTGLGQYLEPISERKVRVAGRDRSDRPVARPPDRQPTGGDAVDLAHPDPHRPHP